MGGVDYMLQQVVDKIAEGYRCVKLKVGGLNFERECDILQYIRRKYFREDITLRLDANGAFKEEDALFKLGELSKYKIESIEQPLKTGSPYLAELCSKSPIPIALDEELIGLHDASAKEELLDRVHPACIVVKPTLHGGLSGAAEWIRLAQARKIGWWLTSALESSIGLNAIAQLASTYSPSVPQGLGTGKIFENNVKSPLSVERGSLFWDPAGSWQDNPDEEQS
jgi:L-alanine-DL-glutamate epimerase-like enolase superfamily enzyme